MTALTVRLPNSVHQKIKELTARDEISVNQFIASAAAEKMASVMTLDYLKSEAAKGNRADFDRRGGSDLDRRRHLDGVRDVQSATNPSLSWRELLWQFMVSTPYDFGGFDRRFIHRKLYLEDVIGESVDVAICIDTSGSIAGKELGEFLGEIQGILDAYPQIRGHLFFAGAALYGPHEFSKDAAIPEARGGGGTAFEPFFDWVRQQDGTPPLCIYFTDGYGSFPATVPDAPVMWVVLPGGLETPKFPFGNVVRLG